MPRLAVLLPRWNRPSKVDEVPGNPAGSGVGLRSQHVNELLDHGTDVPWFELLADNHLAPGGLILAQLKALRERWPLTLHCIGMNLGGTDPLDQLYLNRIQALSELVNAAWISDHLCFTACHGRQYHDLLPLPYTEAALLHITGRIHRIQEQFKQPLVLENVSAYLRFRESALTEAEFLAELVQRTDCKILLDVNNLYVNHINHSDNVDGYLTALPLHAVCEIHLAGYEDQGDYLLDAHNNRVSQPVWKLFEQVIALIPDTPVLIEWDNEIPHFAVLRDEARKAEDIMMRLNHTETVRVSCNE